MGGFITVDGKTTYHGLGPRTTKPGGLQHIDDFKPKPAALPRSTYQAPSTTKPSEGIAQAKPTPIKDGGETKQSTPRRRGR